MMAFIAGIHTTTFRSFSLTTCICVFLVRPRQAQADVSGASLSIDDLTLGSPQNSGADDLSWTYVFDALSEAALTIAVFAACSFALAAHNRWSTRVQRPSKGTAAISSGPLVDPSPQDHLVSPYSPARTVVRNRATAKASRTPLTLAVSSASTPPRRAPPTVETDVLVAAVRAGRFRELPHLLDAAYGRARGGDAARAQATQHLLSTLRACTSIKRHDEALRIYAHVADRVDADSSGIWSLLLWSGVESGAFEECRGFFAKLSAHMPMSSYDFVNSVRCHAHWHDRPGLRNLIDRQGSVGVLVDAITRNRALAACVTEGALDVAEELLADGAWSEPLDTVAYNTLMKGYSRAARYSSCFAMRDQMEAAGLPLSEVTFGILLDACICASDFDRARAVFRDLSDSGIRTNAVHFTTLIKGLVGAGHLTEADALLEDMLQSPQSRPDLITYSTLVKAYADRGLVEPALGLLERMLTSGVRPDEVIFNSMLAACACRGGQPMSAREVLAVFERLVFHGLQPSTTTASILLKALAQSGSWDEATRFLEESPERFGIRIEARLFAQLTEACIRAGQRDWASQTYGDLLCALEKRGMRIDEQLSGRVLKQCVLCRQLRLATDLLDATIRSGGRVERSIAASIRSSSVGVRAFGSFREGQSGRD